MDAQEIAKLAPVSELINKPGKKEGEIRLFRNGDMPEAYMWKMTE
jgi:phospholipase A-2-activating protein